MAKKILYVDMDGVLVDFQSGIDQLDETKQNEYKGREDEDPTLILMDVCKLYLC